MIHDFDRLKDLQSWWPCTEILKVLHEVEELSFHLTGSRYFGMERYLSDIDLFTSYRPETIEFLSGLHPLELADLKFDYADESTFRRAAFQLVEDTPSIDIQLLKNGTGFPAWVHVKQVAQKIIEEKKLLENKGSLERYDVWNQAMVEAKKQLLRRTIELPGTR